MEGYQIVATYANSDFGGKEINELIEEYAGKYSAAITVVPSLGHKRYLSFMREVEFVIGNSSSGIIEAPFLEKAVVNIGDRQKGRYQCGNIVQSDTAEKNIAKAITTVLTRKERDVRDRFYWGDGHTSEQIVKILEEKFNEL